MGEHGLGYKESFLLEYSGIDILNSIESGGTDTGVAADFALFLRNWKREVTENATQNDIKSMIHCLKRLPLEGNYGNAGIFAEVVPLVAFAIDIIRAPMEFSESICKNFMRVLAVISIRSASLTEYLFVNHFLDIFFENALQYSLKTRNIGSQVIANVLIDCPIPAFTLECEKKLLEKCIDLCRSAPGPGPAYLVRVVCCKAPELMADSLEILLSFLSEQLRNSPPQLSQVVEFLHCLCAVLYFHGQVALFVAQDGPLHLALRTVYAAAVTDTASPLCQAVRHTCLNMWRILMQRIPLHRARRLVLLLPVPVFLLSITNGIDQEPLYSFFEALVKCGPMLGDVLFNCNIISAILSSYTNLPYGTRAMIGLLLVAITGMYRGDDMQLLKYLDFARIFWRFYLIYWNAIWSRFKKRLLLDLEFYVNEC
jgi:hypothetical protein